jgi:hypothetical protein
VRSPHNPVSALIFLVTSVTTTLLCFGAPATSLFAAQPQTQTQSPPQAPPPEAPAAFREEVIAQMTPGSTYEAGFVGDKHLAWVEKRSSTRIVLLDGKQQGGAFDEVKSLSFNDDESHFAFLAKRKSSWVLVLDGQEHSPEYSKATSLEFPPARSSPAFGGCNKKKCRLVVDGAETGVEYTDISYPQFSRDGKRLAFLGKHEKKWIANIDGKEVGPELDDIWGSAWGFTRDASRFYVAGRIKNNWMYWIDGQLGPGFGVISYLRFSPDGQHYAYGGAISKGGFKKQKTMGTITLDGQPTATYEGKGMAGGLVQALGGFTETLAMGVRELTPDFHGISTPQFNPQGKLVYAARRDKGDVAVFVGLDAGPGFDEILSPIAFSEDSQHFAYVARDGDNFVEVRDNVPGRSFTSTRHKASDVQWIMMNRDATHLAYQTVSGGNQFTAGATTRALRSVIIDGQSGPEYDALNISRFGFAKDALHYFYEVFGAQGNRDLVNVDGHESKLYDWVAAARFAEEGKTVTFVARDGLRLLRVSCPLN